MASPLEVELRAVARPPSDARAYWHCYLWPFEMALRGLPFPEIEIELNQLVSKGLLEFMVLDGEPHANDDAILVAFTPAGEAWLGLTSKES